MNAEIICVGTELLLGDILNTNARFLARELASLGISLLYQSVVGDNEQRLTAQLRLALERSELIILTGGLGPTKDDLTKEVCCRVMGAELEEDAQTVRDITAFFAARGRTMSENNLKQALLPKGGIKLNNPRGTAPGCVIEKDGRMLAMLPGPPREMQPMFTDELRPLLLKKSGGVIYSKEIRTFGIGESNMAQAVSDLLDSSNPTVAPYAKDGEALLRVTAFAENEAAAKAMCGEITETIKERLGGYIYTTEYSSLEETLLHLLLERGETVALAESCTGGLIAKRITDLPGSSAVFHCGVVSYANEIKEGLLGVKKETIEKYTEVSPECAAEMAEGVRRLSGADYGLSVTGISGPGGASEGKPVGLAYIGFARKDGTDVVRLVTGRQIDSRDYNRVSAASTALHTLLRYLKDGARPAPGKEG